MLCTLWLIMFYKPSVTSKDFHGEIFVGDTNSKALFSLINNIWNFFNWMACMALVVSEPMNQFVPIIDFRVRGFGGKTRKFECQFAKSSAFVYTQEGGEGRIELDEWLSVASSAMIFVMIEQDWTSPLFFFFVAPFMEINSQICIQPDCLCLQFSLWFHHLRFFVWNNRNWGWLKWVICGSAWVVDEICSTCGDDESECLGKLRNYVKLFNLNLEMSETSSKNDVYLCVERKLLESWKIWFKNDSWQ